MSFIGKNIRKIRAVKKLSQADLAAIFNLARPSVGAYEEGRAEPKIDTVIQMAQHFGISIDLLLTKEITINELYHIDKYATGLNQPATEMVKPPEQTSRERKTEGMPLIKAERMYEYISGRKSKDFIAGLPTIQLPLEKNRTNRAFEINSNEMHYLQSGIKAGDIVNTISVVVEPGNLKTGKIYLLVTGDRWYLRRLNAMNKVLEFAADNPDFPAVHIGIEEIDELWEVRGIYSEALEKSDSMASRIFELENAVRELLARVNKLEGNESQG
jgi:transcriptional regulator with XRE-family HTH domain